MWFDKCDCQSVPMIAATENGELSGAGGQQFSVSFHVPAGEEVLAGDNTRSLAGSVVL